ncbi:MAG: 1-phosphofructokinase family hexose kinase [bacterium]
MKSILTITMNPTIDLSMQVDRVIANQKLRCESPQYDPGGGGINVSRVIRELGGESHALYPCGGSTGDMLSQLLDREDIHHHPVSIKQWTRENFTANEKESQQQYRFGMPGPVLSEKEWNQCLEDIASFQPSPDYIIASGSLPPEIPDDFYHRVAEIAQKINSRFILDSSGNPLKKALDTGVYLVKPNIREFRQLFPDRSDQEIRVEDQGQEIISEKKAQILVVSLGSGGVIYVTKDRCEHIRSPEVPIESRIGAGDSMVAGLVLALAREKDLDESVRFGVAAGAAAVMTSGTELCRKEDVMRIFSSMK